MIEKWKDIPEYEGLYQVSNLGRVKSLKYNKQRILKPETIKKGYERVVFSDKKKYLIHRLVLLTFKPDEYFNGAQANHRDCNKHNNTLENLEWCNQSDNMKHAFKNKLIKRNKGSNHINSKLKEHQIPVIRNLYKVLNNYSDIAKLFKVDSAAIRHIIIGKSWTHI